MVPLSKTCSHARHPCLLLSTILQFPVKYRTWMRRTPSLRSSSPIAYVAFTSPHRPQFCAVYSKPWTANFRCWTCCPSTCRQKTEQAWRFQREFWHRFYATSHYLTFLFQCNLSYSDEPRISLRSNHATSQPPPNSTRRTSLHSSLACLVSNP